MEQSLVSQVLFATALPPTAFTGAADGVILDTQGFDSMSFMVHCAVFNNASVIVVQDSDNDQGTFNDVDPGELLYSDALDIGAIGIKQFGYLGKKRYVRVNFVSGNATVAVYACLGHPTRVPTVGDLAAKQFPV